MVVAHRVTYVESIQWKLNGGDKEGSGSGNVEVLGSFLFWVSGLVQGRLSFWLKGVLD